MRRGGGSLAWKETSTLSRILKKFQSCLVLRVLASPASIHASMLGSVLFCSARLRGVSDRLGALFGPQCEPWTATVLIFWAMCSGSSGRFATSYPM